LEPAGQRRDDDAGGHEVRGDERELGRQAGVQEDVGYQ
jgi:hypothetical protein